MKYQQRYISSLAKDTYALILAGGKGSRLHELTKARAKPAVYFGGKHRIIDFPLSNCVNSGIRRVGIATQYRSHSLIRHVQRAWGHFRRELGESVEVLPASQQCGDDWYSGTADAVFQNLDIIRAERPKWVLVLSGDHVYRMDYGQLIAEHVKAGAQMTVSCIETPVEEAAGSFGVMTVNEQSRVIKFSEKPQHPDEIPGKPGVCLASMGNYVFNTDFLIEQLERDAESIESDRDFGNDIIPSIIKKHHILAVPFRDPYNNEKPYWRDVGTLDAFWEANMDLTSPTPQLDLYDANWPIWTYQEQLAPAKFVFDNEERRGMAVDSTVSSGCIISGARIEKSSLFSNVRVNSYTEVSQSVILPDVVIGRNCKIHRAILDRGCEIPSNMEIGINRAEDIANGFRCTDKGVVLVTQEMLRDLAKRKAQNTPEDKLTSLELGNVSISLSSKETNKISA